MSVPQGLTPSLPGADQMAYYLGAPCTFPPIVYHRCSDTIILQLPGNDCLFHYSVTPQEQGPCNEPPDVVHPESGQRGASLRNGHPFRPLDTGLPVLRPWLHLFVFSSLLPSSCKHITLKLLKIGHFRKMCSEDATGLPAHPTPCAPASRLLCSAWHRMPHLLYE